MTNYEKIKSMSVEKMARFILHYMKGCESCTDSLKQWLESEVK